MIRNRYILVFTTIFILHAVLFCQEQHNTPDSQFPLLFHEEFSKGTADNWQPNIPLNWKIEKEDSAYNYRLISPGPFGTPRKPTSYSILTPFSVGSFELVVKARCLEDTETDGRDLCLFYGFQDDVHFYYTHFSNSSGNYHNIIGIVNNADRLSITNELPGTSIARLNDYDWHILKITRNVGTGIIEAYIDSLETPILTAMDTTFRYGKIGIGSFDDFGDFAEVKLYGELINSIDSRIERKRSSFGLYQNFPNPFNPVTIINFTLPKSDMVNLRIFDMTGRVVQTLVHDYFRPGIHKIVWDASSQSSGIYLCRLSFRGQTETRKMILLR